MAEQGFKVGTIQSFSVAMIIAIAKLSAGYADIERNQQRFYQGASIMPNAGLLIAMEADILDWRNANFPDDPTLPYVANYVLSLCGKYINRALAALGQGTGIVIDPSTGQPISFEIYRDDFIIGGSPAPDYPLQDGDTQYTLPLSNIIKNGVNWFPSGALASIGILGASTINDVIYTKDYAIIMLNQPVRNGEVYTVEAFRSGTGTVGAGSGGGFAVPTPFVKGAYLTNTGTIMKWDSPEKKYTSANFSADGVTVVDTDLAIHDYDLYLETPGSIMLNPLVPDTDYTVIASGGFVILLPGFDANTADYVLTAKMKQFSS